MQSRLQQKKNIKYLQFYTKVNYTYVYLMANKAKSCNDALKIVQAYFQRPLAKNPRYIIILTFIQILGLYLNFGDVPCYVFFPRLLHFDRTKRYESPLKLSRHRVLRLFSLLRANDIYPRERNVTLQFNNGFFVFHYALLTSISREL